MLKSLALLGLAVSLSTACFGAPLCVSGSLSSYISLGTAGCSLDNTVFANFNTPSGTMGATTIAPGSIFVNPFTSPGVAGFTFGVNTSASNGNILEALVSYQVQGGPYGLNLVSLNGASATGNGAVTAVENLCAGGSFGSDGVSGCTGVSAGPIAFQTATDNMLMDGTAFARTNLVSVTTDLTIDSGGAGTAALASVTNQFATPEPSSLFLLASGAAGLGLLRRRRVSTLLVEDRKV